MLTCCGWAQPTDPKTLVFSCLRIRLKILHTTHLGHFGPEHLERTANSTKKGNSAKRCTTLPPLRTVKPRKINPESHPEGYDYILDTCIGPFHTWLQQFWSPAFNKLSSVFQMSVQPCSLLTTVGDINNTHVLMSLTGTENI